MRTQAQRYAHAHARMYMHMRAPHGGSGDGSGGKSKLDIGLKNELVPTRTGVPRSGGKSTLHVHVYAGKMHDIWQHRMRHGRTRTSGNTRNA